MDILIEELEGSLWVVALEEGKIQGLEVDPSLEEVRWGSIYWAKVTKIDSALDAAFLDLDGFNTGIIYNKDIRKRTKDNKIVKGGAKAIGKILNPGDMIAVQAKSAYLKKESDDYARIETKTPQMSMDITIQGRYVIYCVMMNKNRISMRIREKALRKQLLSMLDEMENIDGCILRASAVYTQTDILKREGDILKEAWSKMQQYLEGNEAQLIMLGSDAVQRTLSDHSDKIINRIEVVTMNHYKHAEGWCFIFAPDLVTKIIPIEIDNATEDLALFHYRDIIGQIEELFQSYILLSGGGNIIIQETAALTVIDVNKSAHKGSHLSINIEAAIEIARQIRLRNIGGIIVIDFLRLQNKKEAEKLKIALEKEIMLDPCTVQIHGHTSTGLMELTRKRKTLPLQDRFSGMFE